MNRPARSQPPVVDDRSPEQLENELLTLADQYVDDWNADSEDMARELLTVGSEFGSEVIQRSISCRGNTGQDFSRRSAKSQHRRRPPSCRCQSLLRVTLIETCRSLAEPK